MTAKAKTQGIGIEKAASGIFQFSGRFVRVAGREIKSLQTLVETHAALVKQAFALVHIGLAFVSHAKSPWKRHRKQSGAVADRIYARLITARDFVRIRTKLPFHNRMLAKYIRGCGRTRRARHGSRPLRLRYFCMASHTCRSARKIPRSRGPLRRPPPASLQTLRRRHGSLNFLRSHGILSSRERSGRTESQGGNADQYCEQVSSVHGSRIFLLPSVKQSGCREMHHFGTSGFVPVSRCPGLTPGGRS